MTEDLSPLGAVTGRKLAQMQFVHEVRSNGNTTASVEPRLGRLIRGCGFQVTNVTLAPHCVRYVTPNDNNTGDLHIYGKAGGLAYTGKFMRTLVVTITTGGASGVAKATIESPAEAGELAIDMTDTDEVTLTDGTEILVHNTAGVQVMGITPNFQSNNPATGDKYYVEVFPIGYLYRPKSSNFDSLTIYMYLPDDSGQSLLHKMTGSRGSFTMEATGGDYGKFTFTFQGSFVTPVDATTPANSVFETQQPAQVELAAWRLREENHVAAQICAGGFSVDMANEISPRECVNQPNAFQGTLITGRKPSIKTDPEAVLVATHDFWGILASGNSVEFHAKIGTVDGNWNVTSLASWSGEGLAVESK